MPSARRSTVVGRWTRSGSGAASGTYAWNGATDGSEDVSTANQMAEEDPARSEAGGAHSEQEVADLERGVEPRGLLPSLVVGEEVLGAGEVREGAAEVLVEVGVRGQDHDQRGVRGLVAVAVGHVLEEALAGLALADQHDPQRLGVHRGGGVLDEVVDGGDLLVGHGLVAERVGGTGLSEEQVLGFGRECECHARLNGD